MPRCLRSGSRRQKLQVQHIQQVNKTLRVNINQCIAANIDNFNQVEFLSLFGLTQVGMKNGQKPKRGDRMKRTPAQHTDDDIASTMGNAYHTTQLLTHVLIHGYNEAFKHLGKYLTYPNTYILHGNILAAGRSFNGFGVFLQFR